MAFFNISFKFLLISFFILPHQNLFSQDTVTTYTRVAPNTIAAQRYRILASRNRSFIVENQKNQVFELSYNHITKDFTFLNYDKKIKKSSLRNYLFDTESITRLHDPRFYIYLIAQNKPIDWQKRGVKRARSQPNSKSDEASNSEIETTTTGTETNTPSTTDIAYQASIIMLDHTPLPSLRDFGIGDFGIETEEFE